jgi:hypothetical protein
MQQRATRRTDPTDHATTAVLHMWRWQSCWLARRCLPALELWPARTAAARHSNLTGRS